MSVFVWINLFQIFDRISSVRSGYEMETRMRFLNATSNSCFRLVLRKRTPWKFSIFLRNTVQFSCELETGILSSQRSWGAVYLQERNLVPSCFCFVFLRVHLPRQGAKQHPIALSDQILIPISLPAALHES